MMLVVVVCAENLVYVNFVIIHSVGVKLNSFSTKLPIFKSETCITCMALTEQEQKNWIHFSKINPLLFWDALYVVGKQ